MARRAKPANPNTTAPKLPLICAVEVTGFSEDGDVLARQIGTGSEVAALNIKFRENQRWGRRGTARGGPALGIGDRTLVRLTLEADGYRAEIVRRLEAPHRTVLGIYDGTGHIHPTGKSDRFGLMVDTAEDLGAEAGELVVAEVGSSRRAGLAKARIIEKLGTEPGSRVYSQIAIHAHSLPSVFSSAAMNEVATASAISTEGRADLREIPLVTIDSSNARDFDDAVWAEPVPDANGGGWSLIVAIADVAAYVAPGSALDVEAAERGNSVYLADRVIPMLPEALSNGWCSLKPGEDRACLTVHMHIDRAGTMREHRFERAIMRSAAKLTYAEVEAARSAQG
ncbi:MAG: RNB domain-containing ribonuclease, partial [Pseudomonadota bacterium]|nr:RNB domain-containing ribonuclease [Pseudomonadota bacterium]